MNSNRTILLIEDNSSDIALTKRALEKARIANELVVAEDGQEALDYLWATGAYATRDKSEMPMLTLLDLQLPKVSGLEVLRQLRADERTRQLPVVILTSSSEERDIIAGYDLGANSYVRKPVDFTEFVQAIQQLGLYWLILNEPSPRLKTARQR